MTTRQYDAALGWMPVAPLPWYCWQFWKWQKVRCECGKTFVSRSLGLMPPEYEAHYMVNHADAAKEPND